MRKELPQIIEGVEELSQRLRAERNGRRKTRLQVLYLLKSGQAQSRQEVAALVAVHRHTIGRWLAAYERGGLLALLEIQIHSNRRPVLPVPAQRALATKLRSPQGFGSYSEAQQWLQEKWRVRVKYKTLHHWIRYRLKATLKVARPSHVKKTLRRRRPSVRPSGSTSNRRWPGG
jgi:transposase